VCASREVINISNIRSLKSAELLLITVNNILKNDNLRKLYYYYKCIQFLDKKFRKMRADSRSQQGQRFKDKQVVSNDVK
jgi:hypothetical protein